MNRKYQCDGNHKAPECADEQCWLKEPLPRTAKLYASLTGPLLGLYYPMPEELKNEAQFRLALNSSRLKNLWHSIYTPKQVNEQILEFDGSLVLPEVFSKRLDYDSKNLV